MTSAEDTQGENAQGQEKVTYQGRNVSKASLALVWSVVGIPFLWGLYQTIIKSLPLFISGS